MLQVFVVEGKLLKFSNEARSSFKPWAVIFGVIMVVFGLYWSSAHFVQDTDQASSGQDQFGRCVTSNVSYLEERIKTAGDKTTINLCPGDRVKIAHGRSFNLSHVPRENEPAANILKSRELCHLLRVHYSLTSYDAYLCQPSGLTGDGFYTLNVGASYNNVDKWPAGLQFEITRVR